MQQTFTQTVGEVKGRIRALFDHMCNEELMAVTKVARQWETEVSKRREKVDAELTMQEKCIRKMDGMRLDLLGLVAKNDQDDYGDDVPSALRCPITLTLVVDPVLVSDGVTYERKALKEWLHGNRHKQILSPLNGNDLVSSKYFPNQAFEDTVQPVS